MDQSDVTDFDHKTIAGEYSEEVPLLSGRPSGATRTAAPRGTHANRRLDPDRRRLRVSPATDRLSERATGRGRTGQRGVRQNRWDR
eukprot:COSAG04_NODE_495_length_13411_cov_35.496094_11_plen_86_part_00